MVFDSDNAGPAHPAIMQALAAANSGYALPYGADDLMDAVRSRLREVFEAPNAEVHLVATGTAANALCLATLGQPWQAVLCTPMAHIHQDECNAPEFFTGGAKLLPVGAADKMTASQLAAALEALEPHGVHGAQRGPVSITQITELGQLYSCAEIAAIGQVAQRFAVPLHMDGARFANALVAQEGTAAAMTWKAGVRALSFGATKNGCLGVEAVLLFDACPAQSWEFELRRKRAAHLFSKHRYLSAQMLAYLRDDVWLHNARAANAAAARLAERLRQLPEIDFIAEPKANMIFFTAPRGLHQRLMAGGAQYLLWDATLEGDRDAPLIGRLVCDWSTPRENIDRFLALAQRVFTTSGAALTCQE